MRTKKFKLKSTLLLLWSVFFVSTSFSEATDYKECYRLWDSKLYTSAQTCFSDISNTSIYYPYALFYQLNILIRQGRNTKFIETELPRYNKYAITHYGYYRLAKHYYKIGELNKALFFAERVDRKALLEEDDIKFLELKRRIYDELGLYKKERRIEDILIKNYIYSNPGLKAFWRHRYEYSAEDIKGFIRKLLKKYRYNDVIKMAKLLPNSNEKYYYLVWSYAKKKNTRKAEKYLRYIDTNSVYFGRAAYKIYRYSRKKYRVGVRYIHILKRYGQKYYMSKIASELMKRSFYKGLYLKVDYFASFIRHKAFYGEKAWYLALKDYRRGNYENVIDILETYAKYFKDKSKAYYWLHLTYKNLDPELSKYYLIKAASFHDPTSFYSIISRKKINVRKTLLDIKRKPIKLPLDDHLKLIVRLKHDGFYKDAFIEANYYKNRAVTLQDKLRLHQVFPELTAREFARNKDLLGYSFPKPFDYITKEDLVYAIMRQESFFYPYAVSRSGARGLMQIMPKTGRWIAMQLGEWKFSVDDLFIPEKNIKFGRWYIHYLLRKYKGNLIYAIAAYNAGPGNVKKFLRKNKVRDIAEFVEFFHLSETRNYIKKVYINYIFYSEQGYGFEMKKTNY